jgi:20S proteasome alpha/beta subunit
MDILCLRITIPSGSGSTYVYGYCDATYQDGWGKEETVNFVKNSTQGVFGAQNMADL